MREFNLQRRKDLGAVARRWSILLGIALATACSVQAQGNSPWENAVNVLQQSFTGPIAKGLADKAHISTSKTYSQQRDYRFDMKTFTELKNAQSVTLAYDGLDPFSPMFCYLKPYFNDVNKSYFRQLADGQL
jgi:argonaute-like protein implicated in RNA metabolism and viral defense